MKTKAYIIAVCFFIVAHVSISAQSNTDNKEVKAKAAAAVERLDEHFSFEKSKRNTIEDVFTVFYSEQYKLKQNIQRPVSGLGQGLVGQNFQSVRKQNEALIEARDKRLKEELSSDQFKKWKNEIEPSIHTKHNRK